MKKHTPLGRFLIWRAKNISNKQFMMLLSALVGFGVGVAAVIIKNSVHFIQSLLSYGTSGLLGNYLYLAYPFIGILLVLIFVRIILKKNILLFGYVRIYIIDILFYPTFKRSIKKY